MGTNVKMKLKDGPMIGSLECDGNRDIENTEETGEIAHIILDKTKDKKQKDPRKIIAALHGEITKKNKEIDRLRDIIVDKTMEIQNKEKLVRFYEHRNIIKRIFNTKYLDEME